MNKISIALCTYNGAKFLPEQLASFLAQTRLPDELIVCDDFSTDKTLQIIEDFAQTAPFHVKIFRNEKNLGVIKNFEKAVALCTGDIIFLSDQDDIWMPEKISLILQEFDKSPEIGMVFSNAELVDEQMKSLGLFLSDISFTERIQRLDTTDKFFEELLKRNYITGATLAFRSGFREMFLPFPENIPQMIHDAWIAFIIYISAKYSFIEECLIKYRQHPDQQLGIITKNPLEELNKSKISEYFINVRRTECKRIEAILDEFGKRPVLREKLLQIEPTAIKLLVEIREAIRHFEYRRNLPKRKISRLKAVISEFLNGRYGLYSKGILSAGKDFLGIRNISDVKTFYKKVKELKWRLQQRRQKRKSENLYQKWVDETSQMQSTERVEILKQVADSEYKPLISIIMPVYNVDEKWLRLAIESVLTQSYNNWELCIADDRSSAAHIKPILQEYSVKDSRIKVGYRQQNGHISAASNTALKTSTGDFVALLDNDDELAPDALLYVVKEILDNPKVALIYSDEDKIDQDNRRFDAAFKPDWSADLLYSLNLVTHLSVFRRNILIEAGGFRENVDGSQDYDLVLRFVEQIDESQIRHIPRILYHWRAIEGSVALDSNQKTYAHDAARRAISDHFKRKGIAAKVTQGFADYHRVIYELPKLPPKVSLIVENDNLDEVFEETLNVLLSETAYENFNILVGSGRKDFQDFDLKIKSFDVHRKINLLNINTEKSLRAERLNEIAQKADGEILLFIDANLIPLDADWLRELASQAYRNEIGAVGGKILYSDNTVRSAGYILGIKDARGRAHHLFPREAAGNFARLQVINNFSAVSAECLAVKRADFVALDGFDAQNFPKDLFDVDFCLRLEAKGKRNLLTPYAELKQVLPIEEKGISSAESRALSVRWHDRVNDDPFYNPNLTRRNESFQVEFPPRFV